MNRANAIGQHYHAHGWSFASSPPSTPGAAELAGCPSFAGYARSPTLDDAGPPTWIIVEGRQAQRRQKQGDIWHSVKLTGGYDRILTIPKGEQVPAVQGF